MRSGSRAAAPGARAGAVAFAALLALTSSAGEAAHRESGRRGADGEPSAPGVVVVDSAVEPIHEASWIERRNLSFGETALGGMGRSGPTRPGEPELTAPEVPDPPAPGVLMSGSDLYRVSCSSCHGTSGAGAPPEIKPVFGPAQATSAAFLLGRLRARGLSLDASAARDMAAQSEKTIRDRLRDGGERMPPFAHLHPAEVDAILDHLRALGGVPRHGARPVSESVFRVGENIVRGTCQTCHAATGPGPRELASSFDALRHHVRPSLAGIARELSASQFEAKVREGVASDPAAERGVMPVFDYLRPEEVRAAFLYLVAFPPGPPHGTEPRR